jgi:2-iminobutanoate/2-iminopropanoate deaminase
LDRANSGDAGTERWRAAAAKTQPSTRGFTMRPTLIILALMFSAGAAGQEIEVINPEGMTKSANYSHLVKFGDLLFVAGQVATDGEGNIVGEGDMAVQFRQVLENMKTVLASVDADLSNIVKITIYTVDIEALRAVVAIRSEYFGDYAPASTLVQIERLARPEFLLEIEATAVKQ